MTPSIRPRVLFATAALLLDAVLRVVGYRVLVGEVEPA